MTLARTGWTLLAASLLGALVSCSGETDEPAPVTPSGGSSAGGTSAGATGGSGGTAGSGATAGAGGSAAAGGLGPGESVTVQGTGFGSKPQAGPLLYDEFESGTAGSQLQNQPAVVGQWETGAGSENPVYSDAVVRVGARSCLNPFTQAVYNSSLSLNVELTKAYVDYWVYVSPLDPTIPDGLTRNWKPLRLYGNSDNLQSGATFFGNIGQIVYAADLQDGLDNTEWFGSGAFPSNEWFHIQYWLRLNDVGQANGVVRALIRGEDGRAENIEIRGSDVPMNQIRIGHYWATDPVDGWNYTNPGANIYVDTVYVDDSWARVELGDAPSYETCTQREIQRVTAWSDTEVTFVLARGTLPAGTLYAFVIDEQDEVRATEALQAR